MVFKRYIHKHGKKLGPYYYENIRTSDGGIKTIYVGRNPHHHPKHRIRKPLFILILILLLILIFGGSLFVLQNKAYLIKNVRLQEPNFDVDQILLKVLIKSGEFIEKQLRIMNIGSVPTTINIEAHGLSDLVGVDSSYFTLKLGQTKIVILNFSSFVLEQKIEQQPGIYIGKLIVSSEKATKEIPIVVELETKNVLFDMNLNPVALERKVKQGSDTTIEVRLFNLESIEPVNVEVEYFVKDMNGNTIVTESETVVVKTQASFFKTISIPKNLRKGPYVFAAQSKFGSSVGTASYLFEVVGPESESNFVEFCKNSVLCLGLSLTTILLIFALTAYFYFFVGAYLYEKVVGTAQLPAKREQEIIERPKIGIFGKVKNKIRRKREEWKRKRELRKAEREKLETEETLRRVAEERKAQLESRRKQLERQKAEEERSRLEEKLRKQKELEKRSRELEKQKLLEQKRKAEDELKRQSEIEENKKEQQRLAEERKREIEKARQEELIKQKELEQKKREEELRRKKLEDELKRKKELEAKQKEQERIKILEEKKKKEEEFKKQREIEKKNQEKIKAQRLETIKQIEAKLNKNKELFKQQTSELKKLESEKRLLSSNTNEIDTRIKGVEQGILTKLKGYEELKLQKDSLLGKYKTQIEELDKKLKYEQKSQDLKIRELKEKLAKKEHALLTELESAVSKLSPDKRKSVEKWKKLEIKAKLKLEEQDLESELKKYQSKALDKKTEIDDKNKKLLREINEKQSELKKAIDILKSQKQQLLPQKKNAPANLQNIDIKIQKIMQKLESIAKEREQLSIELSKFKQFLAKFSFNFFKNLMSNYRKRAEVIRKQKELRKKQLEAEKSKEKEVMDIQKSGEKIEEETPSADFAKKYEFWKLKKRKGLDNQKPKSDVLELEESIRSLDLIKKIIDKEGNVDETSKDKLQKPKRKISDVFSKLFKKEEKVAKEAKPDRLVGKSKKFQKCYKTLQYSKESIEKNDMPKAKRLYISARNIYVELDYKEKKELYDGLTNLYSQLLNK